MKFIPRYVAVRFRLLGSYYSGSFHRPHRVLPSSYVCISVWLSQRLWLLRMSLLLCSYGSVSLPISMCLVALTSSSCNHKVTISASPNVHVIGFLLCMVLWGIILLREQSRFLRSCKLFHDKFRFLLYTEGISEYASTLATNHLVALSLRPYFGRGVNDSAVGWDTTIPLYPL